MVISSVSTYYAFGNDLAKTLSKNCELALALFGYPLIATDFIDADGREACRGSSTSTSPNCPPRRRNLKSVQEISLELSKGLFETKFQCDRKWTQIFEDKVRARSLERTGPPLVFKGIKHSISQSKEVSVRFWSWQRSSVSELEVSNGTNTL